MVWEPFVITICRIHAMCQIKGLGVEAGNKIYVNHKNWNLVFSLSTPLQGKENRFLGHPSEIGESSGAWLHKMPIIKVSGGWLNFLSGKINDRETMWNVFSARVFLLPQNLGQKQRNCVQFAIWNKIVPNFKSPLNKQVF